MQYSKEKRLTRNLSDKIRQWLKADVILPFATLFLVIYAAYFLFFGKNNLFRFLEKEKQKITLQKDIAKLQRENRYLAEKIDYLKRDIFFIEKKAREDLGLIKDNEEIYIIVDKDIKNQERKERWIDRIIRKYQEFRIR
ncbi:MAG TPA: septum formation initiator family protein [Persephonella sp.]|uniref:Putative septum formation initiator n=1 Tax=Persephonella marina (strain DSM 14350 / EX-H1) TaxID=123214 RepID=C0QRV7_PERMH|nr:MULTISPECIES: septum formation initiator family protein [Persephonella]ACO04859.1 putative septum formation initiator [Persephonella marina EX-H1]HCB69148.1 septum formation initiator family protein [Persephonella sp.]